MSFPRYPAYENSGVEWLGEIPAHWDVRRLRFVASVQTGVAKGKNNSGRVTVEVPYLRVANVQDGYLDLDDVANIEIPADDLPRYLLREGDVLMNEGAITTSWDVATSGIQKSIPAFIRTMSSLYVQDPCLPIGSISKRDLHTPSSIS